MHKLEYRTATRLSFICALAYFASYLTRINFAAVMVELIENAGVLKTSASLVTTILFITYGAGQLISGWLGDRVSPVFLVHVGLLTSIATNIFMPFVVPHTLPMTIIWGINGIAQAFLWPPIVRILSTALAPSDYNRTVPYIGIASSSATIFIYLFSPLIIDLLNWRFVFFTSAAGTALITLLWSIEIRRLLPSVDWHAEKKKKEACKKEALSSPAQKEAVSGALRTALLLLLLSIVLQGALRDGINTWLPTMMCESFHLKSSASILTGVALPVFHALCSVFTCRILRFLKDNIFRCIFLFAALMIAALALLQLFGLHYLVPTILLLSIAFGFVCGINGLHTCYCPILFQDLGGVSFMSGLFNCSVYVGSASSSYLFAGLSEAYGWGATTLTWLLLGIALLILTFLSYAAWRKR